MSSDHRLASLYYSRSPTKPFGIGNKIQVSHKWKRTTREELHSFWASEGCGKQIQSVQFTNSIIQPLFTKAILKAKHVLITRKNTWNGFKLMKSYFTISLMYFKVCFLANRALGKLCVKRRNNVVRKYSSMFFYFKTFQKIWMRCCLESSAVPSVTCVSRFFAILLTFPQPLCIQWDRAVFTFPISLIANLPDGSQLHRNSGLNKPVFTSIQQQCFRDTWCWQFPWEENNESHVSADESPLILSTPVLLSVHSQYVSNII